MLRGPVCFGVLVLGAASAGINWTSVWLEPRKDLVLSCGTTQPYTVMGRSGGDTKADLTRSPDLKLVSSDASVVEIDREKGLLVAKRPGHTHLDFSFSEAFEMAPIFVRAPAASNADPLDGVWKAQFTGPVGETPKMVSEIFFDVDAHGDGLTGTVHAAHWPGDAPISDGKIEGNRVRFTMVGTSPFWANGVIGYPKLCFEGTRAGAEMRIVLRWTEAKRSCEDATLYPMAARKLTN